MMNSQDYYELILNSDINQVLTEIENGKEIWKTESAQEAIKKLWNINYVLILKIPEQNKKMQEEIFYFAYYNEHHNDIRIMEVKDYVVFQDRKILSLTELMKEKEALEKNHLTSKKKRQLNSISEVLSACEKINMKTELEKELEYKQNNVKPKI